MLPKVCVLTLLATGMFAMVGSTSAQCSVGATWVYFGNGVDTTLDEARDAARELRTAVRAKLNTTHGPTLFLPAYNPTDTFHRDLVESAQQVISTESDWTLFWRNLFDYGPVVAWAQAIIRAGVTSYADLTDIDYVPVLQDHVDTYSSILQTGGRVVVVAHSQGNFFANNAAELLNDPEFRIVSVANPAPFVATGAPHTTLDEDEAIRLISRRRIQAGFEPSMSSNFTNLPYLGSDPDGHSFLGTYLQTDPGVSDPGGSRERILNSIVENVRSCAPDAPQIVPMAAGMHTILLQTDGTVWASGSNWAGQLGIGDIADRFSFVQVASDVQAVAAGMHHSLLLKTDGTVWTSGYNSYGQLGTGDITSRSTFVQVASDVQAMAASENHTLLLKTDGTVWASGLNDDGQLGNNSRVSQSTFIQVEDGVRAIAAGHGHSVLLKNDGTVWTVGWNLYGQLCTDDYLRRFTFVQVASDVQAIAAGGGNTLLLKTDGTVWACGDNYHGQFGTGDATAHSTSVQIANNVQAIATGGLHSMLLKTDGTVWTSGENQHGQLGYGVAFTTYPHSSFTFMQVATDVQAVEAGALHSLILKTDGTVWGSGANYVGQFGTGDTTNRTSFTMIFDDASQPSGTLATFELRGVIDEIPNAAALASDSATYGFMPGSVQLGDPFTFQFTLNTATADADPRDTIGDYPAIVSATLTTPGGSYSWTPETLLRPGPLSVLDNFSCSLSSTGGGVACDRLQGAVQTVFVDPANGISFIASFFLEDDDESVFASDAIPSIIDVSALEIASFTGRINRDGPDSVFAGTVTSVVRVE